MHFPTLLLRPPEWEMLFSLFGKKKYQLIETMDVFHQLSKEEQLFSPASDALLASIPAEENGEPLVLLQAFCAEQQSSIIFAFGETAYGSESSSIAQLRLSAAKRLVEAEKNLQILIGKEWTLKVTDTFRPIALQRKHFEALKLKMAKGEQLDKEEIYTRANQLLMDPDLFPSHASGGAIDLTIVNKETLEELPMGTPLDVENDERMFTFHRDLNTEEKTHRLILFWAMTKVGFINFPGEWWHYGYGERDWALRTGEVAAIYDVLNVN